MRTRHGLRLQGHAANGWLDFGSIIEPRDGWYNTCAAWGWLSFYAASDQLRHPVDWVNSHTAKGFGSIIIIEPRDGWYSICAAWGWLSRWLSFYGASEQFRHPVDWVTTNTAKGCLCVGFLETRRWRHSISLI